MMLTPWKNLSQRQIKERMSIIITIIETLIKTKAESIERKKCPLWIPKIECSLYHQLYKPAREGRERPAAWMRTSALVRVGYGRKVGGL